MIEANRDLIGMRVRDHEERIQKLEENQQELRDLIRDIHHTLALGRRVGVVLIMIFGPTLLAAALKFLGA